MNDLIEKEEIKIESMIYEIRGKQVMLDSDLAKLYNVETKRINEAVRRNSEKFPERFSFVLTDEEVNKFEVAICDLKFQKSAYGGRRYNYRVFTEQGVAMLATILKSPVATKVSIAIMDAFVEMRKYIANNNYDKRLSNVEMQLIEHNNKINDYDNKFDEIFNKLDNQVNNHIFFDGQIYDAYSLLIDIFNTSKNSITIIDNYIDKSLFDILSKTNKQVLLITNNYNNQDYIKYKQQYSNIKLKINNNIHDRFIIIDDKELYTCGASFKDLGKKCFAITKIENEIWLEELKKYI